MLKTLAFLILFFGALTLVTLFEQDQESQEVKGEKEEQNLILGYCKTFERYAMALAEENELELIRFGSSFEVLSNLSSGNIDYAVIGRRAYSNEINSEILEIPLKEYGWTLVSVEKDFFEYSKIEEMEVHTYLDESKVKDFFSYKPSLVFHEDLESIPKEKIALIRWEDFHDDFELIIPLDGEDKIEKFRTPILYMREGTKPLENIDL